MAKNDLLLIIVAAVLAIFLPIFMMPIIYPAFQIFLPEGNVILTPTIRITATILMSVIDYGISYILIYHTVKRRRIWFNIICYILTLLWCIVMGMLWYLAI